MGAKKCFYFRTKAHDEAPNFAKKNQTLGIPEILTLPNQLLHIKDNRNRVVIQYAPSILTI